MSECTYTVNDTGKKYSESEFKAYLLDGGLSALVESNIVELEDFDKIETGNALKYAEEAKGVADKIKANEMLYADAIENRSDDFIDALNRELYGSKKFNIDEQGFRESIKKQKDFGLSKQEIIDGFSTIKKVTKKQLKIIDEVFANDAANDNAIQELKQAFTDLAKGEKPKSVLARLTESNVADAVAALKDVLSYRAVSNNQLVEIADRLLASMDINDAQAVLNQMNANKLADVKQILRAKLIIELQKAGNTELATRLVEDMADEATTMGRQTQSLKVAYDLLGAKGSPQIRSAFAKKYAESVQKRAIAENKRLVDILDGKEKQIEKLNEQIHEKTQQSPLIKGIKEIIGKICGNRIKK